MAYSDFDLRTARERFGLTLEEGQDLFADVPEMAASAPLRALLIVEREA